MPESEPKPRPLEAVAPGSGQGWKATLRNGKAAVVHEIPVAPAAAAAAAPRLQRLAEHPHPSLSPILAWGTDATGIWVAVEPNEGTPLSAVLARGRFTPHAAAALGTSVLSGVAALHEAGVAMGGFDATAIRLTSNGEVRLAGHPVAAVRGAPSQGDLRADVRSCGMAICAAFGVDPAGAPAPPELAPGLVVTMRSMASGAMGPAVDRAQGALREMAGPLLAPDRQLAAQSEIALRAGGREMPSITPLVPEAPKPVEDTPVPRGASYEPPPRPVETYSGLPAQPPRPVETYAPPSAYQSSPPAAAPVEPPAPTPAPEPAAPTGPASWEQAAAQPPAPSFASTPPAPAFTPTPPPEPAPAPEPAPPAASLPEPAPEPELSPFLAPAAAAAAAAAASEPAPAEPKPPAAPSTWTPLETGQWTPGPAPAGRVSSSEWTGEATPAPAPVPAEFISPRTAATSTAPPVTNSPVATPPVTSPPVPRAAAPAPVRKPVERRPGSDFFSERPPWLIPAAIAVVLLLLIGTVGVVLLKNRSTSSPHASGSPSPTKTSPRPTASPTGVALLPIPDYGPAANAPLTSVKFCTPSAPCVFGGGVPPAKDTNCTLGGSCHLDFAAFWSGNTVNSLAFTVEFFDRCNNPNSASTTVLQRTDQNVARFRPIYDPAPAGGFAVTLPSGVKAAVLVAIADTGSVKAASAPLALGASSCA
jgi:hypothetical protein